MAEKPSVQQVVERLKQSGLAPSYRWSGLSGGCRLTDGTEVVVSATRELPAGQPLKQTLAVGKQSVAFDATGLAAVRLSAAGDVEALAAGGLRSFAAGTMKIELPEPADVALWRDEKGNWRGVLQGHTGPVPEPLLAITKDWLRLAVPTPLPRDSGRGQ